MLNLLIRAVISGGLVVGGLYMALNIYFNHINKNAIPTTIHLDEETKRKFKVICNMEVRSPIEQEKLIITKFIEDYTREHNIDWNKIEN